MREILSLSRVAELLDISETRVRRFVRAGELKAYKVGPTFLFDASEIDRFIEAHATSRELVSVK